MASATKKNIDMINGPLLKKLIVFSVPLILSGVLQLLFNAADVVVVGQFAGTESLAGVGSTGSLVNLITNLTIGLAVGANVVMARAIGAQSREKASKIVHTSVIVAVAGGVIVALIGYFMSATFLTLMKTDPEVIDKATLYLEIYFLGSPASVLYNFGASLLRAKGDTKRPLYFLIIAGVINVVLNLFFVIVLNMDVAGVAVATVISQAVSAVLVVICLIKDKDYCKMSFRKLRVHGKEFIEILRVGLPAGVYSSLFSLSNVIIQSAVNVFGKAVMAGNSAGSNLEGFVYISMNAFYNAAITFTGQNYGARKYERIKRVFLDCLLLVTVVGAVLGVVFLLLSRFLSSLYSPDPEVINYSITRLKVDLPLYFTCGVMEVLVGVLRGMGYSIVPMIISFLGACVFRIVWVFTVFETWHFLWVLYVSYPVSWILTSAAHFLTYVVSYKKVMKKAACAQLNSQTAANGVSDFTDGDFMETQPVNQENDKTCTQPIMDSCESLSVPLCDVNSASENPFSEEEPSLSHNERANFPDGENPSKEDARQAG